MLKLNEYDESTADNESWEGKLFGAETPTFPYDLKKAYSIDKSALRYTPFGNTLTLQFAEAAVDGENLGNGNSTDFLTINCASTDYQGHLTGPNSIETEDVYLRLDNDLANFFSYLDIKVGKGNYLVFLTADHGGAHAEGFMEKYKMPTGFKPELKNTLNNELKSEFSFGPLILSFENDEIYFDNIKIEQQHLDKDKIIKSTLAIVKKLPGVLYVVEQPDAMNTSIPKRIREMIINGYTRERSGEIKIIWKSGILPDNDKTGTTHGLWNPYDTHIPLLWMGWKVPHGETNQTVFMTDISATLAALLHIQMPSGCIGDPITSLTDKMNR